MGVYPGVTTVELDELAAETAGKFWNVERNSRFFLFLVRKSIL